MYYSVASPTHLQVQDRQLLTGLLSNSCQVTLGWTQAVADLALCWSPSREAPEPIQPMAGFRPQQSTTCLAPRAAHTKIGLDRHQNPLGRIPLHGVSAHTAARMLWLWPLHTASQHEGQSSALTCQQLSRLNYNRRAYEPTQGNSWSIQLR